MNDNSVLPPTVGSDAPVDGVSISDAANQPVTTAVPQPIAPLAVPTPAAAITTPDATNTAGATKLSSESPEIAEDVDLIEKEWVAKAKAIVSRTAQDPNLQTKELGKFKADYLKTRFNKELKIGE